MKPCRYQDYLQLKGVSNPGSNRQNCRFFNGATQSASPTSLADSRLYQLTKKPSAQQQSNATFQIENRRRSIEKLEKAERAADLERFQFRRWKEGDVYSPHDLSWAEMKKLSRPKRGSQIDVFDALAMNPLNEYKVSHISPMLYRPLY